jgi:predicted ribosome quality control (RQC) complex YloA/Tae2 family protein
MPFDAVTLSAVVQELQEPVVGGKIDKIYQPTRDEVILAIRGGKGNGKLLLTANPAHPRIQLTSLSRENPASPPMFCMLLRKHLTNARILSITQPPMERVVDVKLEALDELGVRVERHLILEAMNRRSNLILLGDEGRIIDCLRRVDAEMSIQRQVLPGLFYHLPPAQDKKNPLELSQEELSALVDEMPEEGELSGWLLDTFNGLSPLICRELAYEIGGDTDVRLHQLGENSRHKWAEFLWQQFGRIRNGEFTPYLLTKDGKPKDFSYRPIRQYESAMEGKEEASFSALLDKFYAQRETNERVRQLGQDMIKTVTNARDRTARKLNNQRKELAATFDRETLRQMGDILTSNLYQLQRGMKAAELENYYDEHYATIRIPLDPLLTPQQNAAKYYKDYNKAKNAEKFLTQQIEKGEQELDYLESVLQSLRQAEGERDLSEIRVELEDAGYLRKKTLPKGKKAPKRGAVKPMEFRSTAGLRISVGRNNIQNDQLTCKLAYNSDIWFHTQKIHGSHVILWTEGTTPDDQSLTEAATLAAYYSQARDGQNVPVDYTPVKYVKKPSGARPGMVIYETYSTAYVTPKEELVERLKVK